MQPNSLDMSCVYLCILYKESVKVSTIVEKAFETIKTDIFRKVLCKDLFIILIKKQIKSTCFAMMLTVSCRVCYLEL